MHRGSGVDIGAPPFSLNFIDRKVLLDVFQPTGGIDATIQTVLYRLK